MPKTLKDLENTDDQYSPTTGGRDLYKQNDESIDGYDRPSDGLDDHPVSDGVANGKEPTSNSEKVRQGENQFGYDESSKEQTSAPTRQRVSVWFKKKTATITITTLLGGAGIASLIFSGPSLLLVQIKEVFTNYGSASSRAADSRYKEGLYYRLKNAGSLEKACASPGAVSSVRCKRGSFTEKNIEKLENKGFKVNSKKVGDRHIVSTITDPDGVQMKGTRSSVNAALANPSFGSRMRSAINAKALVFNGGRFNSKVLTPLGLNKSGVETKGNTDEERVQSFNEATGAADEDTPEKTQTKFSEKYEEKIKGVGKIGKGPVAVAGAVCSSYNMTRVTLTAVKLYNASRYAAFALLFLKAADQIKANGSIDPATVALLGGVLTSYASSGPTKGLTATDSQGYKTAAYGGEGKLKSFSQRFLLGGNEKLVDLDNSIKGIQNKVGRNTLKYTCKTIQNDIIGVGAGAAVCGAAGAGGAGAGSVVPVLGTAVGGLVSFAGCLATGFAISLAAGKVIGKIFSWALPKVVASLSDADLSLDKVKGVAAGDGLAAGAGLLMEKGNMSRGMQPGTKSSVVGFNTAMADDTKKSEQIAKYDAQSEPFNINNEYSFLGSLARKSGFITAKPFSLTTLSSVWKSASFTPSASADSSMAISITEKDLDHCPDQNLKDIGVDCDATGGTQYVMDAKITTEDNLNFMIGTYVDESGSSINDSYQNWLDNCTDARTDPLGMTSVGIEDEDDWKTGKACVFNGSEINQDTRNNFSAYYYDTAAQEDEEYIPPIGGAGINAGTYNILRCKADNSNPATCISGRASKAVDIIKQANLDVVSLQEVEENQEDYLKEKLTDYDHVDVGSTRNVFWKKSVFKKLDSGMYTMPKTDQGDAPMPWVKLQSIATGGSVYVLSAHTDVADASNRRTGAKNIVKLIRTKMTDAPVIIGGDMNSQYPGGSSGNKGQQVYEEFTDAGYNLTFASALEKTNADCDTSSPLGKVECGKKPPSHIDAIYLANAPGAVVNTWTTLTSEQAQQASDHHPVIINVSIPGLGGAAENPTATGEAGEFSWPLGEAKWKSNKGAYGKSHPTYSGNAWGKDNMGTGANIGKGIAFDIGSPVGVPVYAMYGGTVTSTNLCGAGDGIAIKSDVGGKTLGVTYMHGQDKKFKVGDKVKSGDQIMEVGEIGCKVTGSHLHVGMAYDGKYLCPQDVFATQGKSVDFGALVKKARVGCG